MSEASEQLQPVIFIIFSHAQDRNRTDQIKHEVKGDILLSNVLQSSVPPIKLHEVEQDLNSVEDINYQLNCVQKLLLTSFNNV